MALHIIHGLSIYTHPLWAVQTNRMFRDVLVPNPALKGPPASSHIVGILLPSRPACRMKWWETHGPIVPDA